MEKSEIAKKIFRFWQVGCQSRFIDRNYAVPSCATGRGTEADGLCRFMYANGNILFTVKPQPWRWMKYSALGCCKMAIKVFK